MFTTCVSYGWIIVAVVSSQISFSFWLAFKENAVILTKLLLVISNILCEICGTAENSLYQSELDRLSSSIPCISTEEYKMYALQMPSLVLFQLGKRYFTSFVTMPNNPLKKKLIHISSISCFPSNSFLITCLPAQSPFSISEKAWCQLSCIFTCSWILWTNFPSAAVLWNNGQWKFLQQCISTELTLYYLVVVRESWWASCCTYKKLGDDPGSSFASSPLGCCAPFTFSSHTLLDNWNCCCLGFLFITFLLCVCQKWSHEGSVTPSFKLVLLPPLAFDILMLPGFVVIYLYFCS